MRHVRTGSPRPAPRHPAPRRSDPRAPAALSRTRPTCDPRRRARRAWLLAPPAVALLLALAACGGAPSATTGGTKVTPSQDLASVVAAAKPGATLDLAGGNYSVSGSLAITKDLTIKGAGQGKTVLEGAASTAPVRGQAASDFGAPVLYVDGATVVIQGVTVRYSGTVESHVAVFQNADVTLRDSRFTGGVHTDPNGYLGDGVNAGSSTVTMDGVTTDGNDWNGVTLVNSTVDVGNGLAKDNGASGIVIVGGGGSVHGNEVTGNVGGIVVLTDTSAGVSDNDVHDNSGHGIMTLNTATSVIEQNRVIHNGESGVLVANDSTPTVRTNTVTDSGFAGINVIDAAAPTLEGNTISGSAASGIEFSGTTAGSASGNDISTSQHAGIWLIDDAAPTLTDNTITGSAWDGIAYHGNAAGTASGNDVGGSQHDGIVILDTAAPTLTDNVVHDGSWSGLSYQGSAGGSATGTTAKGNASAGIWLQDSAAPSISGSTLQDNGECGVFVRDAAAPTLASNTFSGNAIGDTCHLRASSREQFSDVQGQDGWSYGYYGGAIGASFTPADFQQLPSYDPTNQVWAIDPTFATTWTQIGMELMHSNVDPGLAEPEQWAVRRWTSDVSGSVVLVGHLAKADTMTCSSCDGVTGAILTNAGTAWSQHIAADDGAGVNLTLPLTVSQGDPIDVALEPGTTSHADGSLFWVEVLQVQ